MPRKWLIPPSMRPCTLPARVCTSLLGTGTPGPAMVAPGAVLAALPAVLPGAFAGAAWAAVAAAPAASPRTLRLSNPPPAMLVPSPIRLCFSFTLGVALRLGGQLGGAAPVRQAVEGVHRPFDRLALFARQQRQPGGDLVAAHARHVLQDRVPAVG